MMRSKSFKTFVTAIAFGLISTAAIADGPRGFRADWRRAETAVTDALEAARMGSLDDMRSESDTANDALLDLSAYATELPTGAREAYAKALSDARVAAQVALSPGSVKTKEEGVSATQAVLRKITEARITIPADWLRTDVCTGIRKQRRQC